MSGEAHQVPDWAQRRLERSADWVVDILTELTTATRVGPDKVKIPAMPKSAVRHLQHSLSTTGKGLAIVHKIKKGAVFSHTTEKAFVMTKIVDPDGTVRWSAPVFMRGSALGVGCSLGYMRSWICLALMNDRALEAAVKPRSDWGCNWNFLVDMNSSRIKKVYFDSAAAPSQVITDRSGGMMAKYYTIEAAIVDMSLRGGRVVPDMKLNTAIYGPDVDPAQVLAGNVPPPAAYQPVYDLLAHFLAETAPPLKAERDRRGSKHGSKADRVGAHSDAELPHAAGGQAVQAVQSPPGGTGQAVQ